MHNDMSLYAYAALESHLNYKMTGNTHDIKLIPKSIAIGNNNNSRRIT